MSDPVPLTSEPASKERLRLWLRLLKASRMIEAQVRANLKQEFDSTLPRFDVMAALSRHREGLKMSELSGVLRVSNGNVTGIVDRLAEEGLVVRAAVKGDRRASRVCLTGKGHEVFAEQASAHETWIDEMLRGFSREESVAIGARLEGFTNSLEERD